MTDMLELAPPPFTTNGAPRRPTLTPFARPFAAASSPRLILVVDDEESVRTVARAVLTADGHEVLTAPGGREALEVFERRGADVALVLLDLMMPGMGGAEVCRELRLLRPGVRVLLTSGSAGQEVAGLVASLGVSGFLPKPWPAGGLAARVREALG